MACASTSSAFHSNKESLEDCMCTICLCILVHPVTLPCGHELCMPCFKKTVEEASLSCPLCRTRISIWARRAARTNTLVDQKRWEQIQKLFPQRVQRRLDGLDDETDEEIQEKDDVDAGYRRMIQLSEPGEIRKEYEEEIKRLQAQQEEERQKEEEASASLIHNLRSAEEQKLQETRRQQEEIAARDAQLAQELGRLINTVLSDTPVNHKLQESKFNDPNLPLSPSTPTVALTPQDGSHSKGKQPLTKNSNKTLETFFRRLPAGGQRSVRSSSEPKIGGGSEAAGWKNCSGAPSPRCQSAPVRGKENLPLVSNSDAIDVVDDTSFYENLEKGSSFTRDRRGSSHVEIDDSCIVDKGQVEVVDTHDDGQEDVEIVRSAQERAGSPFVASSDRSDSLIVFEEEQEAGGEDEEERGDPLFRPIHSSPGTATQKKANPVHLQSCVVCITPRILFSTDRFSSTTFPIVPSPVVHRKVPSASVGRTGVSAKDHSQKRVGDRLRWADSRGHSKTGRDMGSKMSKLSKDGATNSRHAVSDVRSNQGRFFRRARSSSPQALRGPAGGQQVFCEEQGGFCRPTLQEYRARRKLSSHCEEVVSDSEATSPSPRCRLRPGRLAMDITMRGGGGREVEGVAGHGQADSDTEEESSDGEGEEHRPRLLPTAHDAVPLTRQAQTIRWVVSQEVGDVGSVPSTGGAVGGKSSHSPYHEGDSPPVSPEHAVPSQRCTSPRPVGIFNPDTLPPWSGGLYADSSAVGKGKGKRLLKRADGRGLSHRNCPKSSRKASAPSTSEEEEGSCHGGEKSQAPRSPAHPDSPRIEHGVLPATATNVHAEVLTHPDSVNTVRQVCRMRRTPPYQKNRVSAMKKTSQPALVSDRVDRCQTVSSVPHAGKADKTSKTALNSDKTHKVDKHQTKSKPSVADKTSSEAALNSDRGHRVGRKASQTSIVGEKSEASGVHQRSIKDWFSPSRGDCSSEEAPEPFYSRRRIHSRREVKTSETSMFESDVSGTSSVADLSPSKVILRTSQRARKINPKLDDFWLIDSEKLSQFSMDPFTISDTIPRSTSRSTPTKKLKRKPENDGGRDGSPVKKSRKQSPRPSPRKMPASSVGGRAGMSGQSSQLGGDHTGHTPQKQASHPLSAGGEDGLSAEEEEEEEGLSQEERDRRLALRLQQQFELADKLHLEVVRFKGTKDQYSLRRSRAESKSSKQ